MKFCSYILAMAVVFCSFSAFAQDPIEAYNLSNLNSQSTARSIGFGGALGSVGGDFGAVSVNPAGLGVYRSSELSITPSLKMNNSESQYLTTSTSDNNTNLNVNHFSMVFNSAPKGKRYDRHSWKSVSFAMGVNRVADFNHDYTYTGTNYTSSASQAFESNANMDTNSIYVPGTLGYIGYQSYMLEGGQSHYYSVVPFKQGVQQLNSVKERGGINEYSFALGGNYKEKLLLGAAIGIPYMNYTRTSNYTESVPPNTKNNPESFESFTYNNSLNIFGGGINVKLGAIYNIVDFFRVGAAWHSPTYYSIKEYTDYGIQSLVGGRASNVSTDNYLPRQSFDYHFTTPSKAILSATFILKKLGFISADYEYVNYNSMHYSYPPGFDTTTGTSFAYQATLINNKIKNTYQSVSNVRVGAEIKLTRYFMVRGGVGYYGNPYKDATISGDRLDISGGLGFRTRHFFADLGVVNSSYSFNEQPYSNINYQYVTSGPATDLPIAKVTQHTNNIAFTIGTKF